jgi:hypothetical protein
MSEILKNAPYINLSKGRKYGIKVSANELVLPIGLKDEGEVKEFEQQVRSLYQRTHVGPEHLDVNPDNRHWLNVDDEEVEIGAGNSIVLSSNYYGHIHTSKKLKIGIDTILRYTVLGQKLEKYWVAEEKISEKDAQKRLKEITPLAQPQ